MLIKILYIHDFLYYTVYSILSKFCKKKMKTFEKKCCTNIKILIQMKKKMKIAFIKYIKKIKTLLKQFFFLFKITESKNGINEIKFILSMYLK